MWVGSPKFTSVEERTDKATIGFFHNSFLSHDSLPFFTCTVGRDKMALTFIFFCYYAFEPLQIHPTLYLQAGTFYTDIRNLIEARSQFTRNQGLEMSKICLCLLWPFSTVNTRVHLLFFRIRIQNMHILRKRSNYA